MTTDEIVEVMKEAMQPFFRDQEYDAMVVAAYEAARPLIEAEERERCAKWQPIGTAPRDGSRFLAFEEGRESQRYECWWQNDFGHWEGWMDDWDSEPEPTHWMPLPSAPTIAAAIREGG